MINILRYVVFGLVILIFILLLISVLKKDKVMVKVPSCKKVELTCPAEKITSPPTTSPPTTSPPTKKPKTVPTTVPPTEKPNTSPPTKKTKPPPSKPVAPSFDDGEEGGKETTTPTNINGDRFLSPVSYITFNDEIEKSSDTCPNGWNGKGSANDPCKFPNHPCSPYISEGKTKDQNRDWAIGCRVRWDNMGVPSLCPSGFKGAGFDRFPCEKAGHKCSGAIFTGNTYKDIQNWQKKCDVEWI